MELTRKVLEFVVDPAHCSNGCGSCRFNSEDGEECTSPPERALAALALSLMDERDRYREALEDIAQIGLESSPIVDRIVQARTGYRCRMIARAALEPVQKEGMNA